MTDDEGSREAVEGRTRRWLEDSYRQGFASAAAGYDPVWAGGEPRRMSRYHFQELQRKLKIFRSLDRLSFSSFLDVGAGFDIFPELVAERYGARAYFSDFTHAMNLPYGGADSPRFDRAVTLNAARLPFDDESFDVVLASEVLEHLVRPLEVIAELVRVARKYVVMTSLEALSTNRWERLRSHLRVDVRKAHVERNFFLLEELDAIFAPDWHHENLFFHPHLPAPVFESAQRQDAVYAALDDRSRLIAALRRAVEIDDHRQGAMGILLIKRKAPEFGAPPSAAREAELAAWLIDRAGSYERFVVDVARRLHDNDPTLLPDRERPIAATLLALLRCPDCRGPLVGEGSGTRCPACDCVFPGEYGVPILYPRRFDDGDAGIEDCVRRLCGDDAQRRGVVRRLLKRLRRNERAPGLVRRLLLRTAGASDET